MKNTVSFDLASVTQTEAFGKKLGKLALPGDVITLFGPLGAGKTALTQAIGLGIEVPQSHYITSPTFSLLHEYPGRIPLYHMDLYRLSGEEEVADLGFEEYLYGDGLCVIEWPERLGSLLPENHLQIVLTITSETSRKAELSVFGATWQERITLLSKEFLAKHI